MVTSQIVVLLVTGVGVGFLGGLLGLGGAFIMTPVQYIVYTGMEIPQDLAIKLAFGTSLMVILPTAVSGTWRHHRNGVVYWKAAIIMGSFSLVGSLVGATVATHISGEYLRIAFGVVLLLSGIRMLITKTGNVEEQPRDNPWLWVALALPIGFITGILGIGGGILAVPVMTLVLRFRMHNAVATSLAMMIFASVGGIIGYIVNGMGVSGLPDYSIGYVNLQSWFLLAITSIGMAQVGAMTAHRLSGKYLRYIFITVMFFMGLRMLGVITWLG